MLRKIKKTVYAFSLNLNLPLLILISLLIAAFFPAHAREIKTNNGKTYYDIIAIIPKDDGLIVINSDKVESWIDFRDLPEELQKKYKYDPKKAEVARRKRMEKTKKHEERRLENAKKKKNLRDYIRTNGIPYVVTKKVTLAPKSGGFIYLDEKTVVPVLYEKMPVKGEVYKAPMERLIKAEDYYKNLEAKVAELKKTIEEYPRLLSQYRNERQSVYDKINTLVNSVNSSRTRAVLDANGKVKGYEHYNSLDAATARQVGDLRKQARSLKKKITDLEKTDANQLRQTLLDLENEKETLLVVLRPYIGKMDLTLPDQKESESPQVTTEPIIDKKNVTEKLRKLKDMMDEKLITKEEYEKKKQELLSNF